MMTRKDYVALAASLRSATAELESIAAPQALPTVVRIDVAARVVREHVALALQADNPHFDRARFVKACEEGGSK